MFRKTTEKRCRPTKEKKKQKKKWREKEEDVEN